MPFTIFVQVRPKSVVRKMYGALSSSRGRFTATYAVAGSNADASMMLTRPNSGMSFGVTFAHVFPPSRVTCTSPSSEPAHRMFTSRFDGPSANTVAYTSGPFMSPVIGPPECPIVFGSWRVRSGLIRSQLCPPLVVFHTCCDEVYSTFGSTGEKMIGYVHCQRSFSALDGSPENIRGYGFTSRRWPVRRLVRWRKEPLFPPAKKTSRSFGSGAT